MAEPEVTGWDGLPQNPERDGWHWVQARDDHPTANMRDPFPCDWRAPSGMTGGWVRGVYGPDYAVRHWRYLGPCPLSATETADAGRLTVSDPDLDLNALDRAHGRVAALYRAAMVAGQRDEAAEWEALLVASGYGWPATPREALGNGD